MSDIADPLIGQYIGHYHVKALISQQVDNALYQATDARTLQQVLVKKYFPKDMNAELVEYFTQQARKLIALTHPNIEKVLDFGLDSGYPYLVLQYTGKDSLQNRLETPIPWQDMVKLFLPLTHALFTAHTNGIFHQDLKPASILLSETGAVMLSGLGLPPLPSGSVQNPEPELDTARYWSPEQSQGMPADARSNVYSTGCILYRLATGKLPFDGDTPAEVIQKHLSGSVQPPREIKPQVPAGLQDLILQAMARSPEDRFADMALLGAALQRLITSERPAIMQNASATPSGQGATGATVTNRKKRSNKKSSAARVILTILAVFLAVVVLGSLLISIGGAFLLSRTIQTTFKDSDFTFYNVDVERTETMTEKDARIALNKSLEFDYDLFSNFSVDFQSPDIAMLGAKTPAGKVLLQVQVNDEDGKPQFTLQKLNNIPLLFVGSILSKGINDGLSAAIDDVDFSISELEVTNSRISYSISRK
ncbi:MAG TPA: serine/threonine-protein kinase [Anaerolineaceae bacterium]|nr:serine/threonine-protein kinase [Anaerolineaceae bacterium]